MATPSSARGSAVCALALALALVAVLLPGLGHADPRRSIDDVEREVNALQVKVQQAVEEYDEATITLAKAKRTSASAAARLAREKAAIAGHRARMGRVAAAAYRSGGTDAIMSLVSTASPQTFLDRASSLDRISARQADTLRSLRVAQRRIAEAEAVARSQVQAQRAVERRLAAQKRSIEAALARQQRILSGLRADERRRLAALAAAREAAVARASRDVRPTYTGPASGRAAVAIRFARDQLGKPYRWGGAGPNSYDCSGLTMRAWGAAGVSLPHSSRAQYNSGRRVSRADIQPGDLTFYGSPIHHVGIYVGGGQMISAPHSGDVVKYQAAFRGDYVGAVRP